ncbi:MAG: exonuclease domain-containing protein [bacterium]|nr:exonuclease domain-containing protein [bacterium]
MDTARKLAPAPSPRLDELSYTVLDLETTGGAPPEHRITEVAAYRVEGLEVKGRFHSLVNPQRSIPVFVSSLTGITSEMLKHSPASDVVLEDLGVFAGDSVIVAHHSEFDLKFINHELLRAGKHEITNSDLCTCELARRILPWLPSKSLGNLAGYFGIPMAKRHRADEDALATAQLLIILLRYLQHRGINTLAEARDFQLGRTSYKA